MLGKHNLYPEVGGSFKFTSDRIYSDVDLILWLLFYSDGDRTLLSISRDLDQDLIGLYKIAKVLEEKNIVEILWLRKKIYMMTRILLIGIRKMRKD